MQRARKILSAVLCIIILVCSCVLTVNAESVTGFVNGTNVRIRKEATTTSEEIAKVSNVNVTINYTKEDGQEVSTGNKVWYNVTYTDNNGTAYTGFVYSEFVTLNPQYVYDENFEKNLENFPESYREALRALHAKYPNWKFVANKFDLTFKDAVEAQYGVNNVQDTRKWVEFSYGGNEWRDMRGYNADTDTWLVKESRWTYASRAAIEYFMDPRNSLNEGMIFAFMQQSYHEDENTKENLRTIVKGTFLEAGYDKDGDGNADTDAYIDDLIVAAQSSKVSPYVLAATIIVEQGTDGKTDLISGTYPGFEDCYNFFNFATSGSTTAEMVQSGLTYAKDNGWNDRTSAIIGGANKYADGYIDVGQDTYYYKDFNVVNKIWWHQYASALYDAWTNAKYLQKGCITNTDATITFSIPIFTNMPETACPAPSVVVIPEPTPNPDPEPAPPPEPVIKKGDTNDDGIINAVDLAAVKMHILGVKGLEGNAFKAGDVNSDGAINAVDLAAIKMHILGVKSID